MIDDDVIDREYLVPVLLGCRGPVRFVFAACRAEGLAKADPFVVNLLGSFA